MYYNETVLIHGCVRSVEIMVEEFSYKTFGKIHRKYAQLNVCPAVVTRGATLGIHIQWYGDVQELRLLALANDGETILRKKIGECKPLLNKTLEIPKGLDGELKIVLEAKQEQDWMPVADARVPLLFGFFEQVSQLIAKIKHLEDVSTDNPIMLRAVWAVLAYAEDLEERVKCAEPREIRELKQRYLYVSNLLESLRENKDPFVGKTGYQLRGYRSEMNGELQHYSLYVPREYENGKAWPLVVMLHGAWSNHHLAMRRVFDKTNRPAESDDAAKKMMPKLPDVPYLVVAPNGFETMSYEGFAEEDVWRVIEEVNRQFHVDPDRVYLTGLSMGGGGTAKLGFRNPDRFAALAPVCGFFDAREWNDYDDRQPEFMKRLERLNSTYEIAENILHVPIKIMHGEKDPIVPVRCSKDLYQKLADLGYKCSLEIYPKVEHEAWEPAYENARLFEWFSKFKRNSHPKKIVYKTGEPYGGSAYWIAIQEAENIRAIASIRGEIQENRIEIETDNVLCFSLQFTEELISADIEYTISLDGKKFSPCRPLDKSPIFRKRDQQWEMTDSKPPWRLLPGKKGLLSAFDERQIYVYGTSGTEEETAVGRSLAVDKSLRSGDADVRWQVIADEHVSSEMISNYTMILFSTIHGTYFLRKQMERLPFLVQNNELIFGGRKIKKDQGILVVYPNPVNDDKYMLIGTAYDSEGLKSLRGFVLTKPIRGEVMGDFVVFGKDGIQMWGGLFDKDWRIAEIEEF